MLKKEFQVQRALGTLNVIIENDRFHIGNFSRPFLDVPIFLTNDIERSIMFYDHSKGMAFSGSFSSIIQVKGASSRYAKFTTTCPLFTLSKIPHMDWQPITGSEDIILNIIEDQLTDDEV
ncbi:hypothetical protein LCGC14_1722400 [marine sediment metagenome]|uniref:Uncharacterized protein n=1 Tax=marine sediment metagenome TaxID=412755 RepID=A0A0F9HZR5_9ZZZZ